MSDEKSEGRVWEPGEGHGEGTPETTLEWFNDMDCEALRLEPREFYDKFIVGAAYRFGVGPVLCYDMKAILRGHVEEDEMTESGADEFFHFNTLGAWVGEGTPIFIDRDPFSS